MSIAQDLPYEVFLNTIKATDREVIWKWCSLNKLYNSYCQNPDFIWDLIRYSFDVVVENPTIDDYLLLLLLSRQDYDEIIEKFGRDLLADLKHDLRIFENESSNPQVYHYFFFNNEIPENITFYLSKLPGISLIHEHDMMVYLEPRFEDYRLLTAYREIRDLTNRCRGDGIIILPNLDSTITQLEARVDFDQLIDQLNYPNQGFNFVEGLTKPQISVISEITMPVKTDPLIAEIYDSLLRISYQTQENNRYFSTTSLDDDQFNQIMVVANSLAQAILKFESYGQKNQEPFLQTVGGQIDLFNDYLSGLLQDILMTSNFQHKSNLRQFLDEYLRVKINSPNLEIYEFNDIRFFNPMSH